MNLLINKTTLVELFEYLVTALVAILGFRYIKMIVELVLMELYSLFIQGKPV